MHKIILAALLGAAILPTTPALANQPVWGQHDDHTQNDWHDQKGDYDRRNDQYRRDEDRHDNYRHDNYRHDDYRRDDYRHDNYRHDGRPDAYDSYGRYRQPRPLRRDDHIWRGRDDQAEDQEGQPEVDRKPVLRNARVVDQPALDHIPAHRTLQATEDEETENRGRQSAAQLAADE